MGEWIDFSQIIVDRLKAKVGAKVQRIVFALVEDLGKVTIDSYPSILVIWGGWVVTATTNLKTQIQADGDVRFAVLVVDKLEDDPLTTKSGKRLDDITKEVSKWLLGWHPPLAGPTYRVLPVAQVPFDLDDTLVTMLSEWRIAYRISEAEGVNAP